MIHVTAAFLLIAVLAAVVGWGLGIRIGVAEVLFWLFIGLFVLSLIASAIAGPGDRRIGP